jgi:hypothetical protein
MGLSDLDAVLRPDNDQQGAAMDAPVAVSDASLRWGRTER